MTDKEKLISLMFSYQDVYDSIVVDKAGLAEHLVANGVFVSETGHWIYLGEYQEFNSEEVLSVWKCSNCGHEHAGGKTKRCTECDCKMEDISETLLRTL